LATFDEALQRARQWLSAGDFAQAEAIYRQLLEAAPQAGQLWHELGLVQMQAQRPDIAVESLQKAAMLDPGSAACHSNLGAAYRLLQRPYEAVASFERASKLAPPTAELRNNLALALKDSGQTDAALRTFDEALNIRPDYANGHFNRGNLLLDVGRLDEAVASYRRAIALRPDDAGAHCKLGVAYYDLGQLDQALECFESALQFQPNYPEVRRNRALAWLAQGEYSKGWSEYEWRFECEGFAQRSFAQPRWDGSPLAGRKLLVYAEQGLGDTLQFVRYLPLVEASGGQIRFEVQPALAPLLAQAGFGRWFLAPDAVADFDVHAPLLSLAGFLPSRGCEPFWERPYLAAEPQLVASWEGRVRAIGGFRVGIVWAGNPDHPHDRFRSVRLAEFAPLAAIPGVRLINLQKGAGRRQLADSAAGFDVVDWGDALDEAAGAFMDTAAVMQHLDLVIAVDTAIAHLAGGLGVNVWVPLQVSPDWRWLTQGERTAWYPSMCLFRQHDFDCWPPVFAEMASQLRSLVARPKPFSNRS
jgi:tetratricopeptide (TPR) repeat protein